MKMKMFLSIILLVFYDSNVFSTPLRSKRAVDRQYVENINYMRVKMNIPAYELEWDEGLAALAMEMPSNCEDWKHGLNYRVAPEDPDDNAMKLITVLFYLIYKVSELPPEEQQKFGSQMEKELLQESEEGSLLIFEYLYPTQSRIGCAPANCNINVEGLQMHFGTVCLIGPVRRFTNDDKVENCQSGKNPKLCKGPGTQQWKRDAQGKSGMNAQKISTITKDTKRIAPELGDGKVLKGKRFMDAVEEVKDVDKKSSTGTSIVLPVLISLLFFLG